MEINPSGLALIRRFEGCSLTCYKDIRGLATVGVGHRTDLPIGATITQDEADAFLTQDVANTVKALNSLIKMDLTSNQFSALVSLAYNIGVTAFAGSTLLKVLNAGGIQKVADQIERWDEVDGVVVDGLWRRRAAERALYLQLT